MKMFRKPVCAAIAAACVGAVLVGCGSSPTDSNTKAATANSSDSTLSAVYAAVSGLTGDARYNKLLQLAKQEGGKVSFYHTGTMTDLVKAFTKKTGIQVNDYSTTSENLSEKVLQEEKAGRPGSDIIHGGGADMAALRDAGGIAPLEGPVLDTVAAQFKVKDLISPYEFVSLPVYNTKTLKASDVPKSYEDLFKNFKGVKAVEMTDWVWMSQVVRFYLMKVKGMSESDAIALVTQGMKGATAVDGHTLLAQLLASGQYDFGIDTFYQYIPDLLKKGAPLSYSETNPDLPPVLVTGLAGLTKDSPHPAAGLLFLEYWMSSAGQNVVADEGYSPVANTYTGPPTALQKYPYALTDDEGTMSAAVRKKWQGLFDTLIKGAGSTKTS